MQASIAARGAVLSAVAILGLSGVGCATKKHVRNVVAPIEGRVGEVEKKTASNSQSIGQIETNVSRVDEKATDAGRKAQAAGEDAARANQAAANAATQATDARALAEKGLSATTQAESRINGLNDRIENLDNYQMVNNETILFAFNKDTLSKEGKEKLDQLAQNMSNMKHYVIEVQGFTDKTGPTAYNLELSRRRANAVVRYLTVNHNVPLRRIHVLGVGSENPANTAGTRAARQENRRVEVKIFALSGGTPGTSTSAGSQSMSGQSDRTANSKLPATTQQTNPQR